MMLVGVLIAGVACNSDTACPVLPCPSRVSPAIVVTVNAPAGGIAPGAFVRFAGRDSIPCANGGTCDIDADVGVYGLDVSAPGFATTHRTVVVTANPPTRCGCTFINTVKLAVTLSPS